jgi:phytanoyl-CoA hydroxylase
MYIFKQAKTGEPVNSHQDSTFLFTTPRQTCLGLWLALDDATLDNGCLWVRPKSHREGVRREYKRNKEYFERASEAVCDGAGAIVGGKNDTAAPPMFVMDDLTSGDGTPDGVDENKAMPWEGSLPENGWQGLLDSGFIPVECKAGDLLAFCGTLDHLSLANHSEQARHTFQLHLVEGPAVGVEWSAGNWLQYPDGRPFERMLRTKSQSE